VEYLKQAGCCEIEIGVQSLNEDISKNILNRHVPNQTISKAVDMILASKISLVADNILGLPGQTEKDVLDFVDFYNQKRINRIYAFWLRFYPQTRIARLAKQRNIISAEEYEQILDARINRPFSRGGSIINRNFIKLQILLVLINFLPKKVIAWLSRGKRYCFLPTFIPPGILAAFTSLFSSACNDKIVRRMFFLRYYHALTKKTQISLKRTASKINILLKKMFKKVLVIK
jgi:hypothetical protein